MVTRFIALALLAATLVGCAGHVGRYDFSSVAIKPTEGAVMFVAPPLSRPYTLWLAPLESDREVGNAVIVPVVASHSVIYPPTGFALMVAPVQPGYQVVRVMTWQTHWGACLAEATVGFNVEPGEITYLGLLDPRGTLESLESEIGRTGKGTAQGNQLRIFRKNLAPPSFAFAGAPAPEEALAVARANGLQTSLPVAKQETSPASFISAAGSDLFGYCD